LYHLRDVTRTALTLTRGEAVASGSGRNDVARSSVQLFLHFDGPFTFTDGDRCVFRSRVANSPGIY
jgi:hypothetical protein